MDINISLFQLESLIHDAAAMGARTALSEIGKLRPYSKKSQAFRIYGRKNVERWLRKRLLNPKKDGGNSVEWRIEWLEIESVKKAIEFLNYL